MARKCKTPDKILELIKRHEAHIAYVDEMIRVKTTVPVENQAEHIRSKSIDYMEGLAVGANQMLENALFEYNCYAGFCYRGVPVTHRDEGGGTYLVAPYVGPDNPDFKEWRRQYFTRGPK